MLKKRRNLLALLIAIGVLLYESNIFTLESSGEATASHFTAYLTDIPNDTSFGGIFYSPHIDDSLPYYQYIRAKDSIDNLKEKIQSPSKGIPLSSSSLGNIGVVKMASRQESRNPIIERSDSEIVQLQREINELSVRAESANNKNSFDSIHNKIDLLNKKMNTRLASLYKFQHDREEEEAYNYLSLGGYELKKEEKFFIDKGTYNLAYIVYDSSSKKNQAGPIEGHYERKQIPSRYSEFEKSILIPISKRAYDVLSIAFIIIAIPCVFIGLYFFLGIPIQILVDISRGWAFSPRNIRGFKRMAYILLLFALVRIIEPFMVRLIFYKWIPKEFSMASFRHLLEDNMYLLVFGIGLFIIGKVFEKGFKLQQEQALTI